jgi:hypothetical protein
MQVLTPVDVKVDRGRPMVTGRMLTRLPHHGRREIHADAAAERVCQAQEVPTVTATDLQNGIRRLKTGVPSDQRQPILQEAVRVAMRLRIARGMGVEEMANIAMMPHSGRA